MIKKFKIYLRFLKMHILTGIEYKGWWMICISVTFYVATDPISIVLLFSRFGGIGEWSMERVLLVYMMTVTSYGFAKVFCVGFEDFPWKMIRSGDFDRFLLRPRSLFTQITGSAFRLQRIPWAITGIIAIIWSLFRLNIPFNIFNATVLTLALLGGFLMYTGFFIMTSGIAFFTVKGLDWIYIFTSAARGIARCPADYMPKIVWGAFTFFIPILVISYYPASLICGWNEPAFTGLLSLPAGLLFLGLSVIIWRVGVRHYKSTGS